MNYLSLLSLLLVLWACGPEAQTATGDSTTRAATGEEMAAAPAEAPSEPVREEVRLQPGQTPPTVNEALTMRIGSAGVAPGAEVCLPVTVEGFNELIGLQYTIRWDTTQLAFTGVRNYNLSGLSDGNFGQTFAGRGYLSSSWIDDGLAGVTLPAGTRIYDLCFRATGRAGAVAEVHFANGPTVFEVIDRRENLLRFRYAIGKVRIQ